MGQDSKIEWTTHTFNPWIGCTKVSPGCAHCYAEALMDKRHHRVTWGAGGTRARTSPAYWRQPLTWDRAAKAAGVRSRVFCASLADVFEDRPELDALRRQLFDLIGRTPNLDWLLLTKRPEGWRRLLTRIVPPTASGGGGQVAAAWLDGDAPPNVWLGASVEDRKHGLPRVDKLRSIPAVVRFLSVEPLLEDLGPLDLAGIGWVIVGGESGPNARPMQPEWARSIRDQCVTAAVPFFFKQWGEWLPEGQGPRFLADVIGGRGEHAGRALFPGGNHLPGRPGRGSNGDGAIVARKVGKKAAGRSLDGRTWDEFPAPMTLGEAR